eukprot:647430-Pelagomonas_calceolata.AAC.4
MHTYARTHTAACTGHPLLLGNASAASAAEDSATEGGGGRAAAAAGPGEAEDTGAVPMPRSRLSPVCGTGLPGAGGARTCECWVGCSCSLQQGPTCSIVQHRALIKCHSKGQWCMMIDTFDRSRNFLPCLRTPISTAGPEALHQASMELIALTAVKTVDDSLPRCS